MMTVSAADPVRIYVRAKRRKLPGKDSEDSNKCSLTHLSMDMARVVGKTS